jgi:hypothetical protein
LKRAVELVNQNGELDPPLTSSAAASPARTSPTPDAEPESPESGPVSGLTWPAPFAFYDPDTSSWKTSQPSLFEDLTSLQETWPRSGMTCNGTAFLLPPSAPLTAATDGGQWPTPLGNAVVPQVAEHIGRLVMEFDAQREAA